MSGLHVVVVTGMSGAGRSTALHVLEDLGFFCVDNLPPSLAGALLEELDRDPEIKHVGLGVDVRTRAFLEGAGAALDTLVAGGHDVEVIFFDCQDEILVRRFSETRRPHALADGGDLPGAIRAERDRLGKLRLRANRVFDTTRLSVHDLRRVLVDHVARGPRGQRMTTRLVSFGFKYGLPVDADLVFDLRYLPNPHFVPELREHTGLDPKVAAYVLGSPEAELLLADIMPLLTHSLPHYEREGKSYLTIAVGCTGGKHRSVAVAEELARRLRVDREVVVSHRDVERSNAR